ncbi:MAG TPA: hypothetical protein ENI62_06410 [Gammaproteobacteria bacterium]|nr:hypothetical protein [Gammaproteobacteria bacterium]
MKPVKYLVMAGLLTISTGVFAGTTVHLTATDFKIASDVSKFKVGIPYHFVVKNSGELAHEIMLSKPIAAGTGMTMAQMDKMALGMADAEDLQPGKTVSFDYTFKAGDLAGPLELSCHLEGHYEAGMVLPISVTK